MTAPALCKQCVRYAALGFRCGAHLGECDCPKCQGFCTCHAQTAAEPEVIARTCADCGTVELATHSFEECCANLVQQRNELATRSAAAEEGKAEAERERDYLVSEYERAVKCKPQGFTHAAAYLYNAIANGRAWKSTADVLSVMLEKAETERDAARAQVAAMEAVVNASKAFTAVYDNKDTNAAGFVNAYHGVINAVRALPTPQPEQSNV